MAIQIYQNTVSSSIKLKTLEDKARLPFRIAVRLIFLLSVQTFMAGIGIQKWDCPALPIMFKRVDFCHNPMGPFMATNFSILNFELDNCSRPKFSTSSVVKLFLRFVILYSKKVYTLI